MQNNDAHRYDDMLDLPHPVSDTHARMSMHDRAAQFAPFAALTGFQAAIDKTGCIIQESASDDDPQST